MNPALDRRLQALEATADPTESLKLTLQFVGAGVGVVAALALPSGQKLKRTDDESEASFLARVEAAR